jgi:hypothetical protein
MLRVNVKQSVCRLVLTRVGPFWAPWISVAVRACRRASSAEPCHGLGHQAELRAEMSGWALIEDGSGCYTRAQKILNGPCNFAAGQDWGPLRRIGTR